MAERPETVRRCPVVVLLLYCLFRTGFDVLLVILIERVSILIVKILVLGINELEYTVVVVPYHVTVVLILLIVINRTLNNIPNVVTGTLAETRSVNSCSVRAFPVEFGFRSTILVDSAIE